MSEGLDDGQLFHLLCQLVTLGCGNNKRVGS